MLSYWEKQSFLPPSDITIVGSGIVGLTTAIALRKQYPDIRIVVLERGALPSGASTKNAGFCCFGSIGELEDDRDSLGEEAMLKTVAMRLEGLDKLLSMLGREVINYKHCGGTEFFKDEVNYNQHAQKTPYYNQLLKDHFQLEETFKSCAIQFGEEYYHHGLHNKYEGCIHTGKMMQALINLCTDKDIKIVNGISVTSWEDQGSHVIIETSLGSLETKKLCIATNAFSHRLIPEIDVTPHRNQVIVTSPSQKQIPEGTYHYHKGYVYFRPIGDRLLIGGGRHLFPTQEQTDTLDTTDNVTQWLLAFAQSVSQDQSLKIEHAWSGIIATGNSKQPIIQSISKNVSLGVRLGGMGVAIGSLVGHNLANIVLSDG